jgi:DNA-binding CsgD family transcriptional regulator
VLAELASALVSREPRSCGGRFANPAAAGVRRRHAPRSISEVADQGPLGLRGDLARDAIVQACASGLAERQLFELVAARLRPVVPYAAAGWLSTDPATLLYTDAVAEGVDSDLHLQFFENELVEPDFAKFADILRRPQPVAVLAEATCGEPERSARHRTIHRPLGFSGELRAVFATGGACWGVTCLTRRDGEPDFSRDEAAFVSSLCEHIANGLRTALLLKAIDEAPASDAPGMIVLGPQGEIASISDSAQHWLAQLPQEHLPLPSAAHAVALRARAAATGQDQGVPRARVRARSGQWLLMHGTCLRTPDGVAQQIAIVIEPARRAEIASIIVELYELTRREQQVTQLLVRGLTIDDIAQALWLSRHTVRDHVKAIFAKAGVTSRPELTAKLFAEQFLPELEAKPISGA